MSMFLNQAISLSNARLNAMHRPWSCGACRVLRRRCMTSCPFAPYFPPHDTYRFRALHRVFGASRTRRLMRGLHPVQRRRAVDVLVREALIRLRDPINGCMGVIETLQNELAGTAAERDALRSANSRYLCMLLQGRAAAPPAAQPQGEVVVAGSQPCAQRPTRNMSFDRPYSRNSLLCRAGVVEAAGSPPGDQGRPRLPLTISRSFPPLFEDVEAAGFPPGGQGRPRLPLTISRSVPPLFGDVVAAGSPPGGQGRPRLPLTISRSFPPLFEDVEAAGSPPGGQGRLRLPLTISRSVPPLFGDVEAAGSPPGGQGRPRLPLTISRRAPPLFEDVEAAGFPPGGHGRPRLPLTISRRVPPLFEDVEATGSPADGQSPNLTLSLAGPYWRNPPPANPDTEGRACAAAMASRIADALRRNAGDGGEPETRNPEPGEFRFVQLGGVPKIEWNEYMEGSQGEGSGAMNDDAAEESSAGGNGEV